jgi:metal-sulfur cluster biosynthetic enzyme
MRDGKYLIVINVHVTSHDDHVTIKYTLTSVACDLKSSELTISRHLMLSHTKLLDKSLGYNEYFIQVQCNLTSARDRVQEYDVIYQQAQAPRRP